MESAERASEPLNKTFPLSQVIIISILTMGASIFGFFEGSFFNTYIEMVLHEKYIYISIMVSVSAIFGLIFVLVFGTLSDNSRSKYGRRRPYFLFGGIVAGIAMCVYPFSPNFMWCFLIDAIIIGVFSNMFYGATRPLIPDVVEVEHRGRANAIVSIFGLIATLLPIGVTLYVNEAYGQQVGGKTIINQQGHIMVCLFGGLCIVVVTIIGFLFLKEKSLTELPQSRGFFEDINKSFQIDELKKHKDFFKIIVALTIFNTGLRIITPFLFNYVFSLGLSTFGIFLAIILITPSVLIGNIALGRLADKYGRKKFVAPVILISSVGFFLIPFYRPDTMLNGLILILAVILVLIASICLFVPLGAWQQDLLPKDERGKFIGILNIIGTVSQIPGAIIGGIIADTYGIQWIFAFVPIFLIGSIPFFYLVKETLPEANKLIKNAT